MRAGDEKGFTLIELMVVVGAIAILASIAVPLALTFETRTRIEATEQEMQSLRVGLEAYYEDHGIFPADIDSLDTGGYLAGDLATQDPGADAWLNDYVYTINGMSADLQSWGPDATASTTDDIALTASAGVVARTETRDEIATIHIALRNYESIRIPSSLPDLPNHWLDAGPIDGAFTELVTEGLLPNEVRFHTDSWGSTYAYPGTPADYVTSPGLGAGP